MEMLDCENIESTYASIQNITGLKINALESLFSNLDLDDYYKKNPTVYSFEYAIINILEEKFKVNFKAKSTAWFHATRIFNNNKFCGDILPLGMIINQIWQQLYIITKKHINENYWNSFKVEFENNNSGRHSKYLYNMKVNDRLHWGPYSFLIRDTILEPKEMGNWDYLGSPEIIYDICDSFKDYTQIDLLELYLEASSPAIIKFSDSTFYPKYLGFALYYLYLNYFGDSVNTSCNYCFDGNGSAISSKNILGIEKIYFYESNL